jgi:hypothetical protein
MATVVRSRAYLLIAVALAILTFVAFSKTYYLRRWFDVPPITLLMHLHGIVFTAWFVLFVIQARLVATHRVRTHMQLGIAGAVVAALVVIVGLATTVVSASSDRIRAGMNGAQFVLLPTVAIVAFGGLVAAALWFRRRADIHRRLIMLAMIAVLGPPVARVLILAGLGKHFLLAQTAVAAVFVLACVVADWTRHRTVHPIYAIGGTLLVLSWPARVWAAKTPAWEAVGEWMARGSDLLEL